MRLVAIAAGGLLAWSVLANLVLGDVAYVPRNLALTAGLLLLAHRLGLTADELGLRRDRLPSGLRWGGVSVVVVAAVLVVGVALADVLSPVAQLLADDRAAVSGGALAYAVLVRIPLGTALFEEVAFRGVLRALCRRRLGRSAVWWTSVTFGLWHIAPTIVTLRINGVPPTSFGGTATIVGTVLATTVAGLVFDRLRAGSGSLAAPILAHTATNSLGLLAAALSG